MDLYLDRPPPTETAGEMLVQLGCGVRRVEHVRTYGGQRKRIARGGAQVPKEALGVATILVVSVVPTC